MDNLKEVQLIDLVHRLNQIEVEQQKLYLEYNLIVNELWDRIPSLQKDCNIQPKIIQKKIGGLYNGKENNSTN